MTTPFKISVVVPVYNAGEKLIPSIESLLNQTLQELEIILVNDASTDISGIVIDQLAQDHSSIVPVHLADNKGVHEARLAGLKVSTAPWIGFLDADDFARPSMFASLHSAALENNVDIVVCGSDRVTERRTVLVPKLRFRHSEKVETSVFERFCGFEFGTGTLWNKLYKRSVIEPWFDLHFPWRQSINEDLILNIGCFLGASSVFTLASTLHEYVCNPMSVTSNVDRSEAFVDTYRAYAIAVYCFHQYGPEVLEGITSMYRHQLEWPSYRVDDLSRMRPYVAAMEEASRVVCDYYPAGLALLASRSSRKRGYREALFRFLTLIDSRLRSAPLRNRLASSGGKVAELGVRARDPSGRG